MNIKLLLPRRKHGNPSWLKKLFRRIGDFRYFRGKGYSVTASWFLSGSILYD